MALAIALASSASARAQAGQEPNPKLVLCSLADLPPEAQLEARDALLAQFSLLEADLRFEAGAAGAPLQPLGERIASGQRRASELGAIVVVWIDAQSGDRWFLHMMDPATERVLVRPVEAGPERRGAAIEAIAVMVRESTRALLEGAPLPSEARAPPPQATAPREASSTLPAAAPPLVEPEPSGGRQPLQRPFQLWLAYHGDEFAQESGLANGVAVGAGWFGPMPIYVGARFILTPEIRVSADKEDIVFELQRTPVAVCAGFRQRAGFGAFDLELGFITEVLRHNTPRGEGDAILDNPKPGTRVLFALAPRVRGELFAAPFVSFFATLGMDVLLNNFQYQANVRADPEPRETLLHISGLRPVAELGLAFYP